MKDILKHTSVKIAAAVTIVTGLAFFGLDVSELRPAWSYEHQQLAKDFYSSECDRLNNEWYRAKEVEQRYKAEGKPVPEYLLKRLIYLKAKMKEYKCS